MPAPRADPPRDLAAARRRVRTVTAAAAGMAAAGAALHVALAGGAGMRLLAAGLAGAGAGGGALWTLARRSARDPAAAEREAWLRLLVGITGGLLLAGAAVPRGPAVVGAAALAGGLAAPLLRAVVERAHAVLETLVRGPRADPAAASLLRAAAAREEALRWRWAAQLLSLRALLPPAAAPADRAGAEAAGSARR
jgi:hypothetical protein